MFEGIAKFVLRHKRFVVAILAATTLVALYGVSQLRVDFSFDQFMGTNDPMFKSTMDARKLWGPDDNTVLVLVQRDEPFGTPEGIETLAAIEASLAQSPAIKTVLGLASLPRVKSDGMLTLSRLHEDINDISADALIAITQERFVEGVLLSKDQTLTAISISLDINSDDIFIVYPALQKLRTRLAALEQEHSVQTSMAGIPAVRSELVEGILGNQTYFISLASVLMLLTVLWLFRRPHGVLIPALAAGVPTIWLLGTMGFSGEAFGILSQVYPALIPVIAVADSIHIIQRFHLLLEEHQHPEGLEERRALIALAIRHTGAACFFTSATTAIGFFSLVSAEMTVLVRFGLFAGIGVIGSFICMIVLVPLCLDSVKKRPAPSRANALGLSKITAWSIKRPRLVVLASVLFIFAAVAMGTRTEVDNDLDDSLMKSGDTAHAHILANEKLAGVISCQLDIRSESSLLEPKPLAALAAFEDWAFEHPIPRVALGPAFGLRQLNEAFTQAPGLPKNAALAEQLLVLSESDEGPSFITDDRKQARVLVTLPDIGGKAFQHFDVEMQQKADALFEGTGAVTEVTGITKIAYLGLNRLAGELALSLMIAALIVTLLLLAVFRSFAFTWMSILPNLAPLAVCYGAMGLLGWNFDPGSTVVFTVALGIAVDDTIHLFSRIRELDDGKTSAQNIVLAAVDSTGSAMFTTSLILGVGFGVVGLSGFPITRVFGSLSAIAIFSAFIFDIVVLPALYVWVFDKRNQPSKSDR